MESSQFADGLRAAMCKTQIDCVATLKMVSMRRALKPHSRKLTKAWFTSEVTTTTPPAQMLRWALKFKKTVQKIMAEIWRPIRRPSRKTQRRLNCLHTACQNATTVLATSTSSKITKLFTFDLDSVKVWRPVKKIFLRLSRASSPNKRRASYLTQISWCVGRSDAATALVTLFRLVPIITCPQMRTNPWTNYLLLRKLVASLIWLFLAVSKPQLLPFPALFTLRA